MIGEAKVTGAESGDNQGGGPSLGRLTEKLDPNILHIPLAQQTTPTVNRTLWATPSSSVPSVWSWGLLQSSATCLPTASPDAQEEVGPVGPYLVHPAAYAPEPSWVGVAVGAFENIGAYPEHVLSAVHYDELPTQQGAVWQSFPAASVWNALAPKGTVRNLKGRQAAVAYREHGGEAFHYVVTSYDERGRVEALLRYTENLGYDAVYYTYNSANQVLSVRVCDPLRQHATWYGYDANGRMEKMWTLLGATGTGVGTRTLACPTPLTKPTTADMSYSYDRMGRVEQMVYAPENIVTKYEYHKRGWLDSLFAVPVSLPSDTVFKQSLARDAVGRIVGQRSLHKGQSAVEESYKYDALNQLIEWSIAGGSTVTYSYDDVGNRLSDDEQGATRSYSYSGAKPNQLTTIWSGTKEIKYNYDANGSVTSRITKDNGVTLQQHFYTYTSGGLVRKFEDALPSAVGTVCAGAGVSQNVQRYDWRYRYSASGEREQKRLYVSPHGDACGSSHVWGYYLLGAGDEQLAVYGGRQTSEALCGQTGRRVYMYAEAYNSLGGVASIVTRVDGSKELNLRDHLGSVRTVIKSGGALQQYDYKPYGALRWSSGSGYKREGYIGKEEDKESGLGDYGVRKYDPTTGRFMSVDALYEVQAGWSPYHYAYNDPVNGSDGSGMFSQTEGSGHDGDWERIFGEGGVGDGEQYGGFGSGGSVSIGGSSEAAAFDARWAAIVARDIEVYLYKKFGGGGGSQNLSSDGGLAVAHWVGGNDYEFDPGVQVEVIGNRPKMYAATSFLLGSMQGARDFASGNGAGMFPTATISEYKPGAARSVGGVVRSVPVVGGVVDGTWMILQSLAGVRMATHIDGAVEMGQERMEGFADVSSFFMPTSATGVKLSGGAMMLAGITKIPKSVVGLKVVGRASKGTLVSSLTATKVLNAIGWNRALRPPMWTPTGVKASNLGTAIGRWSAVAGAGLIGLGYLLDE